MVQFICCQNVYSYSHCEIRSCKILILSHVNVFQIFERAANSKSFIPFTYLLDSVLQLVALEEDDKHRLVHIIPLEQKKGCPVIAQLFTEVSMIANYNRVLLFLPLNLRIQSPYLHSESRTYLNITETVTRKAIFRSLSMEHPYRTCVY